MSRFAAILATAFSICYAQTPAQQKDSVTVSAGYTKEQLKIADEFDMKFAAARGSIRENSKGAVKQLLALLDIIAENSFLDHNRPQVLDNLGQAYLAAGQPGEAIKIFDQRLALETANCKPQSTYPAGCAEVQMALASVKFVENDTNAGVELMRQSVDNFRLQTRIEKGWEARELPHYVNLYKTGEALLVYASMLAGVGNRTEAKHAIQQSITALNEIVANTEVQASLRADAQKYLDAARKLAAY